MEHQLLLEIRQFLEESGLSPSYFGKISAGNSELVSRLEEGKTVTMRTAERVRGFMAERRGHQERAA